MKKILIIITTMLLFPINSYALTTSAKSSILIEASTNKVIFEENKDIELPPASMTKMMLLLLVMERIDNGTLKLNDTVTISKKASDMGGSQVYLEEGATYTVETLLKSVAIASANDSAVALAEKIASSTDDAVKLMNDKVYSLGLKHTSFKNVHGLDEDGHYSSSYDMAIIASNLLKYEDILKYSSIYEDYINHPNGNSTWIVNTNKLINHYEGLDGLKTGYTTSSLYCITATAKRNGMRLISVVMGEENNKIRNEDTLSLLNFGFSNYKIENIVSNDKELGSINVNFGKKTKTKLYIDSNITDLTSSIEKNEYSYKIEKRNIFAPIKKGDLLGKIILYKNNKKEKEYNLYSKENIKKANIFILFIRNIINLTSGNKKN